MPRSQAEPPVWRSDLGDFPGPVGERSPGFEDRPGPAPGDFGLLVGWLLLTVRLPGLCVTLPGLGSGRLTSQEFAATVKGTVPLTTCMGCDESIEKSVEND